MPRERRTSGCGFAAAARRAASVVTWLAIGAGVAGGVSSCGGDNGASHLVLYVSADDYVAREVVRAFEEQTGIRVDLVGDTEVNKNTGLANRIRAEASSPRADVFWSSECFMMIQLAEEGLLEPFSHADVESWPVELRDAARRWHGFAPRARVIVYSTERVSPEEAPKTWIHLTRERWRGRVVMADPRFGTTRGHLGALKVFFDGQLPGGYEAFLGNLAYNQARLLTSGNAGVVQAVARGEADVGMTDTDDVWAAQRNGAKVDLVYPWHGEENERGAGTLVIPNTVALIRGAKNHEQAGEFIRFLLSERVERMLVESDSRNIPIRESVMKDYPQYAVPEPLRIDLKRVAEVMDGAVEAAMRILGSSAGES